MTETKKENEREIVLAILIEVLEKNQFSHFKNGCLSAEIYGCSGACSL